MTPAKAGVRIAIGSDFDAKGFLAAEKRTAALKELQLAGSDTMAGRWVATGHAMQNLGAKVGSVGQSVAGVGDSLTQTVTMPLLIAGAYSYKLSVDFEQSMNLVRAATGAPGAQMAKLSDLAKKMGADTVFSANEASGAMLELAKSGMTPAQIAAGALDASLQLAAAGQISLESSATTTANAINMFALEASDAAAVADAFAGGANASSASVDSLQQALSQVGPGARNAGLDLQDTVGVLAAFADRGIQGSDAGTSLKTMLSRLIPATSSAADAMDKYNLSFSDSKGNIDDITVVAQKLQDKLGGLSEAQRSAALTQIFGSDATRAASVMMELGSKGTRKYIDATKDREAAERMADAAMKGSKGTIEQMRGSVETAALDVGTALTPMVMKAAKYAERLADAFSALEPEQQDQIVAWLAMCAGAGIVFKVAGEVALTFSALSTIGGAAQVTGAKMGAQIMKLNAASISASQGLSTMSAGSVAMSAGYVALSAAVGYAIGNMINQIPWVIEKQKALGESIGELVYQHKAAQIASDATVAKWKADGIQLDENNNITDLGMQQLQALNRAHGREQVAVGAAGYALKMYRGELASMRSEQRSAERADIALEWARLRVTDCQKALTSAVHDFGKNSLQAKSAALDLRDANAALTEKADLAADQVNATNTALAGSVTAPKTSNGRLPVYGTGADLTHTGSHVALVGDEPELIFPLGDVAFAAQYLPVLMGSLPKPSATVPARSGRLPAASAPASARPQSQRSINVGISAPTFFDYRRIAQEIQSVIDEPIVFARVN